MEVPASQFSGTEGNPKVYEGNVQVDASSVDELENAVIKGNLVLTGSNETLTISNVTVQGSLDLSNFDGNQAGLSGIEVQGETIL